MRQLQDDPFRDHPVPGPSRREPPPDDPSPGRRSMRAWALALGVALAGAAVWALLRSVLDVGVGLLAVSALIGWGIAAALRPTLRAWWPALGLAGLTWVLALVLSWLVAMAILPGSTRTFAERLAATPFLDWLAPQLGVLEIAGLVLILAAAAYAARGRGALS